MDNPAAASGGVRRPKKRPSYGIRTVELTRGNLGFGFTLSGQGPCILSSIVETSPAYKAKLKPGDHVIAVNGRNVSKTSHDEVVSLIGNSTGLMKLQIAENYCSSSDEEWSKNFSDDEQYNVQKGQISPTIQQPLKPFHFRANSEDSTLTEASEIQANLRPKRISPRKKVAAKMKQPQKLDLNGGQELLLTEREINSFLHPTLDELRKSFKLQNKAGLQIDLSQAVTKAVVGYLGTIEMPKENQVSLQAIRSCIRRLRVEKKVHTMVLMVIFAEKIILINHHGVKLAEYPAHQVSFCGKGTDNKQFFGLVTTRRIQSNSDEEESAEETFSSSCHVFMTEGQITADEITRRSAAFQFEPTQISADEYKEFPRTADPIVETIVDLYKKINEIDAEDLEESNFYENVSPPPSSNSDSGIGFKDPGAVGGGLLENPDNFDDSFNTERLESQNSADNLRQSMQRYLASKHQHLKQASENLLNNRTDQRGAENFGLPPYQPPPRPPPLPIPTMTKNLLLGENLAKSAEHLSGDHYPLKLTNFNSETNLANSDQQPQQQLGILKPCDQYPSEPGVLKNTSRPLSSMSNGGVFMGNLKPKSYESDDPSEAEIDLESKASENKGWSRSSSIRKHLRRRSFSSSRIDQVGNRGSANSAESGHRAAGGEDVTITDERDPETTSQAGSLASERGIDIGRVGSWATDFEKLLTDPIGLRTFAEFLKKEFSHENIYFWTACERYRKIKGDDEEAVRQRMAAAEEIIKRHLSTGAPEPVNVDSHARQAAHEGPPTAHLFAAAQKQIYNLMKFDSFTRFLKSDLYKDNLMAEMSGKSLPFEASDDPHLDIGIPLLHHVSTNSLGRKSQETSSRRRSILPSWSNLRKDRSKSKDRESSIKKAKGNEQYHSMTSLASNEPSNLDTTNENESDGGQTGSNCSLARVILPDKATTVVQTRPGETIRSMVARLLEKRALRYTSFDVFAANSDKPLDLGEESTTLGCIEVRVEPRVLFRLELPSKKSIGVKAKPAKLVKEVLGPILNQYGWSLEAMSVRRDVPNSHGGHVDPEMALVDLEATVASIDNSRLLVAPKTADINSELLRDLLRSKSLSKELDQISHASSQDSSEKRKSGLFYKQPKNEDEEKMPPPEVIPSARKHKFPSKPSSTITEDLYEGLKLAQRGRLEDQRGTEIKFEMPEFLKRAGSSTTTNNKENFGPPPYQNPPNSSRSMTSRQSEPILPQPPQHRPQSMRRDIFPDRLSTSSSYARLQHTPQQHQPHSLDYFPNHHNDSSFLNDGFMPSLQEAERYFGPPSETSRLSLGMRFHNDPMYETLSQYRSGGQRRWSNTPGHGQRFLMRREPPPLPPKPRLPPAPPHALRSTQSDVGILPSSRSHHQQDHPRSGGQHHRDSGYSVSFV